MSLLISFIVLLVILFFSEKYAKPYNLYINTAAIVIFLLIVIARLWWLFIIIGLAIYLWRFLSNRHGPSGSQPGGSDSFGYGDYEDPFSSNRPPKDVTPKDEDHSDK